MSRTGKFRDQRKQMSVCLGLREEEWGVTAPGDRVSFGADEHNWELQVMVAKYWKGPK